MSASNEGAPLKPHHLRPAPGAKTAKTRVGRGRAGARGKTAGRGTKGSKARGTVSARFEGGQMPLHMRLPKLKGFKNPFRVEYQVVNLARLSALYPEGGSSAPARSRLPSRSVRTRSPRRRRRRSPRQAGRRPSSEAPRRRRYPPVSSTLAWSVLSRLPRVNQHVHRLGRTIGKRTCGRRA
jgi:ribosomal protein L15